MLSLVPVATQRSPQCASAKPKGGPPGPIGDSARVRAKRKFTGLENVGRQTESWRFRLTWEEPRFKYSRHVKITKARRAHPVRGKDRSPPDHNISFSRTNFLPTNADSGHKKGSSSCR